MYTGHGSQNILITDQDTFAERLPASAVDTLRVFQDDDPWMNIRVHITNATI